MAKPDRVVPVTEIAHLCHADHMLQGAIEAALADCGYHYRTADDSWTKAPGDAGT
jgi:hypothetical protein